MTEREQTQAALCGRILDTALTLAEERGSWGSLRLHDVADALDIPLAEIHACYAQQDDLAEAWFDRADRAALRVREGSDFADLPPAARLERVMLAWLEALQPHRRLTRGMLAYKLEPGHLHLQLQPLQPQAGQRLVGTVVAVQRCVMASKPMGELIPAI